MKYIFALCILATLTACGPSTETAASLERKKQAELSLQSVQQVGMPAIVNFAEKRMMKDIIELRDQNVATTTYTIDMSGKLHKLCTSVGYGLPYATQFTSPQSMQNDGAGHWSLLPQADPNGLYSPASADGTWVLCVDPKGKPRPVFIEPRVIVSPFSLD